MDIFGRLESVDERDSEYPMSAVTPAAIAGVNYRYWNDNQWWGNQERNPWCVAYAWLHWAEDGPVTHKQAPPPLASPKFVYDRSQQIDEWPGVDYNGTSVRAGAKSLQELGIISGYHWAQNYNDVVVALLTTGPVVVGSRWYAGMSRPDNSYRLQLSGSVVGGHAYVLNGVNIDKQLFRMKNSWGRRWGRSGRAYLDFGDLGALLDQGGEACLAIETN